MHMPLKLLAICEKLNLPHYNDKLIRYMWSPQVKLDGDCLNLFINSIWSETCVPVGHSLLVGTDGSIDAVLYVGGTAEPRGDPSVRPCHLMIIHLTYWRLVMNPCHRDEIAVCAFWRTWRRPPTSSLLLDRSCRRTRRRRRQWWEKRALPWHLSRTANCTHIYQKAKQVVICYL